MDARKEMNDHLARIVVPKLRSIGFKGSFPHFRRILPNRIHLLTFQFDRYGGGFVIEIANCKAEGYTTSWGKKIEPNKITAHDLYVRKRIQSNMETSNSLTDDWFRYDQSKSSAGLNIYQKVCEDVLSKLEVAEEYWKNGELNS